MPFAFCKYYLVSFIFIVIKIAYERRKERWKEGGMDG